MPTIFEWAARRTAKGLRYFVTATIIMILSVPIVAVFASNSLAVVCFGGAMFVSGVAMLSVWFHPETGLLVRRQPRWKRMIAWPGAIALDFWFLLSIVTIWGRVLPFP